MARYSTERKQAILQKLLPPTSMTVAELSQAEGISKTTLYNWQDQLKQEGLPVSGKKSNPEQWSAEAKLAAVTATSTMSAAEVSAYCREKGLHVEQLKRWKEECLSAFGHSKKSDQVQQKQAKADKAKIRKLEKELNRKEKALAETAALLTLRKKLDAFWGDDQEEN